MSVRGDQQLKVGPKSLEGVDQEETVDGHGHIGVVGTFGERGLHACHLKDVIRQGQLSCLIQVLSLSSFDVS